MTRSRLSLATVLLVSVVFRLAAQSEQKSPWSFSISELRTYWFGVVPTGLDTVLQWRGLQFVPGLDTVVENDAGGGYQQNVFFRNTDGSPLIGSDAGTTFPQVEFVDDLGLKQGIIWNRDLDRNLIEAFAFYRFHFDYNLEDATNPIVFESSFPDRKKILANALLIGMDYDSTAIDKVHKTRNGLYIEASAEWGPPFLFNGIGGADYYRFNLTAYGYKTLFTSTTKGGRNLFSLYVGDFAATDYAGGASIPIYVMQTIGGRYPRYGVGDAVRGFEAGAYDTRLKIVDSLELRATGPAVVWPDLVPGAYVFLDAGFYDGYFGDPNATPGGFLASTGVGVYVDFFGLANATIYIGLPVVGRRVDGKSYAVVTHFHLQF